MTFARLLAAWMVLFLGNVVCHTTVWAGGDSEINPLSIDVSRCPHPAATPACAAWSRALCQWQKRPELCADVGLGNWVIYEQVPLSFGEPVIPRAHVGRVAFSVPAIRRVRKGADISGALVAPGLIEFDTDPMLGAGDQLILGVREVSLGRFRKGRSGDDDWERYVGTHELMVGPYHPTSEFYRKEDGHWILVSWDSEGLDCKEGPNTWWLAICALQYSFGTWFSEISELTNGQWLKENWSVAEYRHFFNRLNGLEDGQ